MTLGKRQRPEPDLLIVKAEADRANDQTTFKPPSGHPVAFTYQLDEATGAYAVSGVQHDRLRTALPFEVDIDLTAIDEL